MAISVGEKSKSFVKGMALLGFVLAAPVASANIYNVDGVKVPVNNAPVGYQTSYQALGAGSTIGTVLPTTLQGYGWFTGFGQPGSNSNYCFTSNCILTFQFGDINQTSVSTNATTGSGSATYAGGWMKVYVESTDPTSSTYFNTGSNTYNSAGTGTLLLSLLMNPSATINASFSNFGTAAFSGTFNGGFLNAIGGDAGGLFPYGFTMSGQFPNPPSASADGYNLTGTLGGYSLHAVPEPSDLGMMGLGLLMVGMLGLRMRQSRFRRD